jgi:plastocyanin
MELVQTVLVEIPTDRSSEISAPGGLLSELESHREELREEPGFQGMRITRSITTAGNVLLTVETRWRDGASLSAYGLQTPNAASIVRAHEAELLPDTLQVLRGESVVDTSEPAAATLGERSSFAIFVPIGVPLIGLAIIYALSRIYLALPSNVATGLAAVVALGILGIAALIATNPKMPKWQISTILTAVLAVFAVGFIYAGIHGKEETPVVFGNETPTATVPGGNGGGAALTIAAKNVKFDQTTATIPGGAVTIAFNNQDTGVLHNLHIFQGTDATGASVGATDEAAGPVTQQLQVNLTQGTAYFYRCDVHPDQMKGTLSVTAPAPGGAPPPGGAPGAGGPPSGAAGETLTVVAKNVKFDQSTLDAKAGDVAIDFDNQDTGVPHNFHLYQGNDNTGATVGATNVASGPDKQTLTVKLSPGSYFYDCEVHPTQMTGKLQVSGP